MDVVKRSAIKRPGVRILNNPRQRPVDLKGELKAEIRTLLVVEGYGLDPLGSRLGKELNRHGCEGVA